MDARKTDSRQVARPNLRLGRVTCEACGKRVGVVWMGHLPELVDLKPVECPAEDGTQGMALRIHRCGLTTRRPTR